nr:ankyrin repeat-containing protein [Tanacetum cinerariifolium]
MRVFQACRISVKSGIYVVTTRKRRTGEELIPGDAKRQNTVLRGTNSARLFSQMWHSFSPARIEKTPSIFVFRCMLHQLLVTGKLLRTSLTDTQSGYGVLSLITVRQHFILQLQHKSQANRTLCRNLVKLMTDDDLELQDIYGFTAFCKVALAGNVKRCEYLFEKNHKLLDIPARNGKMPLNLARNEKRGLQMEDMNLTSRDIVVEMTMSTDRDIGSSVEDLNTTKQDHKNSTASPSHSLPKLPCEDLLGRRESYFDICVPLYQASITGDWKTAKGILGRRPELVRYAIAEGNDTALHVAASAEETKLTKHFVKNLVNMMTKKDMETQNKNNNTALCSRGMLPLYMSALQGRHNTVKYLYAASEMMSSRFWTDEKWGWMLLGCVECDFFDIALQIVKDHPELSTDMSIGVLARKPCAFKRAEKNLIRRIIHSIMSMRSAHEEDTAALKLLKIIWRHTLRRREKYEIDHILKGPPQPTDEGILYRFRMLFVAAEMGNTRFVVELLRAYPGLIFEKNDDEHTIFHIAVMHCHQGINNLLYEIGSRKDRITDIEDRGSNNMLHLLALTAVKMRSRTSRASLLMQRELLWFKEIEKMLPAHMRENKNANDQTAYKLFSEMNADLVSRSLDWMKDCLVTLFISVAAMMVTYSASFFMLYRNGLRWVPILIATFAALPVILFAGLQSPLLWDMSRSMYDSRIALESIFNSIHHKPLEYTSFGKPNPFVFKNAESVLNQLQLMTSVAVFPSERLGMGAFRIALESIFNSDPVDWSRDIQVLCDILRSGGLPGEKSEHQPDMYFAADDLEYQVINYIHILLT